MILYHTTKSKPNDPGVIPIDTEAALSLSSLGMRTVKAKGVVRHLGIVWKLPTLTAPSEDGKKGRHDGHVYELLIEPEWLDALEKLLLAAREQFKTAELPKGIRTNITAADSESETHGDDE
jgi:hypothetical protein